MFEPTRLPLDKHVLFTSTSLDEVRDRTAEVLSRCFLQVRGGYAFSARHHYVGLNALSLNYIQYGSATTIEPGLLDDFYALLIPLEGRVELEIDAQRYAFSSEASAILSPSSYLRMDWSADCRILFVRLNRSRVETILEAEIGRVVYKPLIFEPIIARTQAFGASLFRFISYLVGEIEATAPTLLYGSVIDHLESSVIEMLLKGQKHNYVYDLENTRGIIPACVRRVEKYVDFNADRNIKLDDLLAVAGVSASTLRTSFRRFRGVTVTEHVRLVKLERARSDLLSASAGTTVTSIASRWGFEQFGRFAGLYRQRYNETPSQTLRRTTNQETPEN